MGSFNKGIVMFNLTKRIIANGCYKATSYERGVQYFHGGAIESLKYSPEQHTVHGSVKGIRSYMVRARFSKNGNLEQSYCTCPDYANYPGYLCKHLVAVLLYIEKNNFDPRLWHTKEITENLFAHFSGLNIPSVKQELNLEINLNFSAIRGNSESSLEIKVGLDKLYVVKEIKSFLEAVYYSRELAFGKKFAYDPTSHQFKDEDAKILEMLWETYQVEELIQEISYDSSHISSVFSGKSFQLSGQQLKRLLILFENRPLLLSINGGLQEVNIIKGDVPLAFKLSKDGENIVIEDIIGADLIPLTKCGSYYYYNGKIYQPSLEQQEFIGPYYRSVTGLGGADLNILPEYKERFISEILPRFKKAGTVQLNPALTEEIDEIPLKAQFYLDLEDDILVGELHFLYGERDINPFRAQVPNINGRILLRDVEQEKLIMAMLEQSEFKVGNGKIYLDDEEQIFDFIYRLLPQIQENTEIYYGEKIKRKSFIYLPKFKGRIALNQESDMLDFSFQIEGVEKDEIFNILKSYKEKKKYFRLKNGSFLPLEDREFAELDSLMSALNIKKADLQKDILKLPKYRAMYLDQLFQEKELSFFQRDKAFKKLTQAVKDPEELDFTIPEGLEKILREYQKQGFYWLKSLAYYGFGGILADDMGLGKTLQAIAFILSERKEKIKPALIIAPTSLIYNWQAELERFAPGLKIKIIDGAKGEREKLLEDLAGVDLVLTSYPLLRRDIEEYQSMEFSCCILDEAQYIKNFQSQTAQATKLIRTEKRFALTGTPIENSVLELWSIFEFLMPGYLPSYTNFQKKYLSPIEKDQDPAATREFSRLVRPFILRRVKEDVLPELPPKIENKMVSELTDEQKKCYLAYHAQIRSELTEEINEKGFARSRIKVLAGLTRLRQICCHPGMFLENFQGESGKLIQLQEVLREVIDSGHRVLLFSQFTKMLAIIQKMLDEEKYRYFYLDGSINSKERLKMVNDFNNGEGEVFLISLKAGGTGLNLTGADVVIHFDPWWNPAVEEQASDRAHRIGQKKVVQVMKFVSKGTIEEKIYQLQEKKKELIDKLVKPGEDFAKVLDQEELYQLLELNH